MRRHGPRIRILTTLLAIAVVGAPILGQPPVARAATATLDNWSVTYTTSDGDGIILTGATFNGIKVFARASLPFVKVNYAETSGCCTDNFDNTVRKAGPTLVDFSGGFEINAVSCFGSCKPYNATDAFSYKYVERYFFYATGLWRAELDLYGPGIYPTATYEVLWRVDYDITDAADDTFETYTGGSWVSRTTEAMFCDDGANAAAGNEWRQSDASPLRRYLTDPLSVGLKYCDLALLYHGAEVTSTGASYPTTWDNNESINGADLVQWHWGFRAYTRPAGCGAGGAGCTTSYAVYFWGEDAGY